METDLLTSTFLRIQSRLRDMAQRMLGSNDDAGDALQEAFLRLWQRRDSFSSSSHTEGSAVTTVRNICIDTLRRPVCTVSTDDREISDIPDDSAQATTTEIDDTLTRVRAIIDTALPPMQRAVIYMRDMEQRPIAEIARLTSMSEANVRMTLSRARRAVRECYFNHSKNRL